jgi:hypothetical protein
MSLQLANANVVIVAHQFNPSVFSELWLVRNRLLQEEDREIGCVFTDPLVNVRSREFNLLATPDQVQFAPRGPAEGHQELILAKVGAIVELLPHVPYHAVGLNFVWQFDPAPETVAGASRRLFFVPERRVFRQFDTEDAQFGTYLSKNSLGCRLKLDIKPVMVTTIEENEMRVSPAITFGFNYHLDVVSEENPPMRIREMLAQWDVAKAEAEQIARDAEAAE